MPNKFYIFPLLMLLAVTAGISQNNTYSPYSRYGMGELNQPTFAHNNGMGGAYIAHKPDSMMPTFINAGNPAAYSLIRNTSLEVGGKFLYSRFKANSSSLTKWNTSFAYGAIGFPIRKNGGAAFGIMPYSNMGYDLKTTAEASNIGPVDYLYSGTGTLNKAFLGYGVMPFHKRLVKFRGKHLYNPTDSLRYKRFAYRTREVFGKLLSDLSLGVNGNYIFGSLTQTAKVIYPSTILYNNTYRERSFVMGDFTGNFGLQTAFTIDSTGNGSGRAKRIENEVAALRSQNIYSEEELMIKSDSLYRKYGYRKRAMKEKVKITFGGFMTLNNALKSSYDLSGYNYILNGFGEEIMRDTVLYSINQSGTIRLPLEQGIGIGIKKGEKLNIVADFAITNWQSFKFLDNTDTYKNNYRMAIGMNYVPDRMAAGNGALWRKMHYRLGGNYNTGYIQLANGALVSNYEVSAGLGIPVGINRNSAMVNISAQYGYTGPFSNSGIKENYWRINFGFTFSDRWFQKMLEY